MATTFQTLTYDQQMTRLDALADEAVRAYNLMNPHITLAGYTNNAMYRIESDEGVFALRIHRAGLKKDITWIQSELMWLRSLSTETSLRIPEPMSEIYTGALDGVDDPVYCVLFRWVEGQAYPPEDLSLQQVEKIGVFAAQLHHFSVDYAPPAEFDRPRLDWEGLFGENSPYHSDAEGTFYSEQQREVIDNAANYVRDVMESLDHHKHFGLIHGDLIAKNILFEGEQVGAIDFDDCAYGYYLYDLSPMLWVNRTAANFVAIREALWRGYLSIRPVYSDDAQTLEAFLLARHIASCRWVIGNRDHPAIRGKAADIIKARVGEMERFLQTGRLWH